MDLRRRRVIWTVQARTYLDEAIAFVARDSVESARRLLTEVLAAAASLATLTERGRVVPEIDSANIREIMVGRYRLIYFVSEDAATVLAILHGARDLRQLQRRGGLDL